jgi:TetR/AcrR family transcriptional repressor of nem operon
MRDSGLRHGGFYKHFGSKDELLLEALRGGFPGNRGNLGSWAEQAPPGDAWKAIVKTYLRPEMCEHPERGW